MIKSSLLTALLLVRPSLSTDQVEDIAQLESNLVDTDFVTLLDTKKHDLEVSIDYLERLKSIRPSFLEWKETYNKVYESFEHEWERMMVWIKHDEFIEKHNSQEPAPSYSLGHNQYSDIPNEEFKKMFSLGQHSLPTEVILQKHKENVAKNLLFSQGEDYEAFKSEIRYLTEESKKNNLPDEVDWVAAGAVTPVKNQGRCGACWAFSTTGAIEGAKFINTGELVSLSEQNLMDCDHVDHSCEGGLMENAFQFDETFQGLCSEDDYPYLAKDEDKCKRDCTKVPGTTVKSFIDIPESDEHGLLASIVLQPTSIAMQADSLSFQLYSGGVFDDPDCGSEGEIDHGVLAVGFGLDEESGHKYIKVKNSWGDSWGEGGYIRLKRWSKNQWGTCAILRIMTAPTLV